MFVCVEQQVCVRVNASVCACDVCVHVDNDSDQHMTTPL